MARKISFDIPTTPDQTSQEKQPASPANRVRPLLGLDRPIKQSGALGAISQSLGGISEKVKRAEEIEQKLIEGQVIVELDPALIDVSFVPDRMEATEEQNAAFRELIRAHGQNVPILVRPKPSVADRYEVAFGHRRLRAARDLGIKVRAVVRALTDEQLVIAQGQENSGRTDLTFIERARFAARLEDRKFSREVIMAALNIDKAAVSRLIAIATRMPADVIDSIGPAPSFGRVRWQELTDLLELENKRAHAIEIVKAPGFGVLDTDVRFETLMAELREKPSRARAETWAASDGTHAAKVSRAGKKLTLTFDDRVAPKFGEFVRQRLQTLYDEFKTGKSST
ncbi:plasmid partitioning protein RepB [Nitrobacter winogradskyi]|uniref:ParB family chromosome partitioning protein n=2 Tax=Nitrobacter winogradskyi TaxID=913 RepID=A0ACC6AN97_NITWI|nr:plasmid partitioning protein RepB [Nitrobacter winogradskyi]MCP2001139.1 ParB family chromosome partitioning protein [Nitrobacter winogradskyi]GEC17159.1 plasmid partitioning protein RepB [Nitrobacter winogradskyi]